MNFNVFAPSPTRSLLPPPSLAVEMWPDLWYLGYLFIYFDYFFYFIQAIKIYKSKEYIKNVNTFTTIRVGQMKEVA